MSYFELVKKFMETAGQDEKSYDLSDEKLKNFRLSLIEEELSELKEALKNNDRVETLDAIIDLIYVVVGAGIAFDMDLDKAFKIVHDSNMSKFCKSEEEAIKTVEFYKNSTIYDSVSYRKYKDFWIVYNKSTGKILKSINYTPAKLNI